MDDNTFGQEDERGSSGTPLPTPENTEKSEGMEELDSASQQYSYESRSWREPEPVSGSEAKIIAKNITEIMGRGNHIVELPDTRFEGLTEFLRILYEEGSISFDTLDDLARHLCSLRASEQQIQIMKADPKNNEFIINTPKYTLEMILEALAETEVVENLDSLMR
jgi:hypothetical protein